MKVPVSWLAEYVQIALAPHELAERLTMSGSLVERVEHTGSRWDDIVVARVARLDRHPDADTLWLATLDLGDREQTVVTGAQNLHAGALVPFIPVGKRLPGQEKPLEPKMLRGIRSEGMVCSGRELGLSDDHSGILILDPLLDARATGETRVVGRQLAEVLGETVIDLEITPNRPDCLSIYGIAREVAAITESALRPLPGTLSESTTPVEALASVRVDAADLCSRCTGRVITGVTIGPSPAWMVERLQAAGMRSINNVVDVTNYVMLELGQPLHAYDLDTLAGALIAVRRATPGETITTLDGSRRELAPEMLVIADAERAVGVAGVMGSAETEVGTGTTRILLEAATFNARSVRRTGIALGLRSEASSRFEKGLPPPLAALASERAAALIAELAGGTVARGMLDVGESQAPQRAIAFDSADVARLLGVEWPVERISGNLERLGFRCAPIAQGRFRVTVPWWRDDVDESADLVEEVARVTGFDAIPETLLKGSVAPRAASAHQRWAEPTRRLLLSCGLSEGSSPGLTSRQTLELLRPTLSDDGWLEAAVPHPEAVRDAGALFEPVRVVNPLTPERAILRPSLLPGLLEALRDNLRNGEDRAAFFELDRCAFARRGDLPLERMTLALALAGERHPRSWTQPSAPIDFYDLRGVVERLVAALGLGTAAIVQGAGALLHPGRAAELRVDGVALGWFGELHPAIAERWDLGSHRAYVGEFDFEALAARATAGRAFAAYPNVPVAKRDIAVIVDEPVPAEQVLSAIHEAGKERVSRVVLFDVYRGDPVPEGRKSLACAVELQAGDRTLNEDEIDRVMGRITRSLERRLGARFRT